MKEDFGKKTKIMNLDIFITTPDGLTILPTEEIVYLESKSNYTNIYLKDQVQTVSRTLKHFENKLPIGKFVRIHNSYIINITQIKTIIKKKPMKIILKNNAELPLSENKREVFFGYLEQYAIIL